MGLLHVNASYPYISIVYQLFVLSALVKITAGHCYTTSISVPEMIKPRHINLALNIEAEISSLEHSIMELTNEIQMLPPAAPLFLALICLSGFDLSEMNEVPVNRTLFAAYVLPKTTYVLLAHPTGITSSLTKNKINFYQGPAINKQLFDRLVSSYLIDWEAVISSIGKQLFDRLVTVI